MVKEKIKELVSRSDDGNNKKKIDYNKRFSK